MKKALSLCLALLFLLLPMAAHASAEKSWQGSGTREDPYLLKTKEDLLLLQTKVNGGEHYDGAWFRQEADLDLKGINWEPIGPCDSELSFDGTYDGNGHVIKNLVTAASGNNGFFGQLGGTVMNLGIESGELHGACVGAISSHASSERAQIVNCYNRAAVYGGRAGGIADNFIGSIVNCWTDCLLVGESESGDIFSYAASFVQNCYTNNGQADQVDAERLNRDLISTSALSGLSLEQLNRWENVDGSVRFSTEKRAFQWSDLPQLMLVNSAKIMVAAIALFQLLLATRAIYLFLKKEKAGLQTPGE